MACRSAPTALAAGYRLIALRRIGSTNAEALRRGARRRDRPALVRRRRQTAGRGRRGRAWGSPRGNLYATCSLTTARRLRRHARLRRRAGARRGARASPTLPSDRLDADPAAGRPLRLKWPNDVLVDGAKLAGILLEGETRGEGESRVVDRHRRQLSSHPTDLPIPPSALAASASAATLPSSVRGARRTPGSAARASGAGRAASPRSASLARPRRGLGGADHGTSAGDGRCGDLRGPSTRQGRLVPGQADGTRAGSPAGEVHPRRDHDGCADDGKRLTRTISSSCRSAASARSA